MINPNISGDVQMIESIKGNPSDVKRFLKERIAANDANYALKEWGL